MTAVGRVAKCHGSRGYICVKKWLNVEKVFSPCKLFDILQLWQRVKPTWPLSSQGLAFKFSLTVGSNFSFTLDTKVLASDTQAKKKKSSPSTIRRNARRREEFLIKKQNLAPVSPARPLRHLPSPTASSERRQVIAFRRDGTMPSFSQSDGNVNESQLLLLERHPLPPSSTHWQGHT